MFGYVTIDKPNILVKDYYTYKSYYCGLCKATGKNYNQLLRLTVNYDMVLLSLLAHNYEDVEPSFSEERCILHPVGKKFSVARSPLIARIVDMNIILAYYKVLDDVSDDGAKKAIERYLRPKYRRLKAKYPKLCESLDKLFQELTELEELSLDYEMKAETFGKILQAVAAEAVGGKNDILLDSVMLNIGKWIYYIDAIDDIKKDFEEKKHNALLPKGTETIDEEFFDKNEKEWRRLLYSAIAEIRERYDKMPINISEGALSNIIYKGLPMRTEAVLSKRGNKKCITRSKYSV